MDVKNSCQIGIGKFPTIAIKATPKETGKTAIIPLVSA